MQIRSNCAFVINWPSFTVTIASGRLSPEKRDVSHVICENMLRGLCLQSLLILILIFGFHRIRTMSSATNHRVSKMCTYVAASVAASIVSPYLDISGWWYHQQRCSYSGKAQTCRPHSAIKMENIPWQNDVINIVCCAQSRICNDIDDDVLPMNRQSSLRALI